MTVLLREALCKNCGRKIGLVARWPNDTEPDWRHHGSGSVYCAYAVAEPEEK